MPPASLITPVWYRPVTRLHGQQQRRRRARFHLSGLPPTVDEEDVHGGTKWFSEHANEARQPSPTRCRGVIRTPYSSKDSVRFAAVRVNSRFLLSRCRDAISWLGFVDCIYVRSTGGKSAPAT